jgi:hypothetical protein
MPEDDSLGRIKRKRIRWQPPFGSHLFRYRLYWAQEGDLNYASDNADLGPVSEVLLPDDVPSFPLIRGEVHLGITAVSESGNESDMTKTVADLDFIVPDAPLDLVVEDVD